jgi:hypothetical protein
MAAIHFAQLEEHGIEEVIDDALSSPLAPESTSRLPDENAGNAERSECFGAAARHNVKGRRRRWKLPFLFANQRRRKVFGQLVGKMPGADSRPSHPFANDIGRVNNNVHEG